MALHSRSQVCNLTCYHKTMSRLYKRLIVVNIFGGLFYIFCLLQWLWAILPYLPGFISLATKIQPVTEQPSVVMQASSSQPPSLFMVVLASIIVVGILAVTAYVLIKLPVAIGKTGEKFTKGASQYLVPVVSHHATLTPKKRLRLATRIVMIIKVTLCVLPVIVTAFSFSMALTVPFDVTLIVAAFLAIVSFTLLAAQVGLARILHVALKDSW